MIYRTKGIALCRGFQNKENWRRGKETKGADYTELLFDYNGRCCVSVCTQVRTERAREKTTQQQILLEIPALQVV